MKQNTIPALLVVIAVLLGLNLASSNERPAEAATPVQAEDPSVVQITSAMRGSQYLMLFRLWSDGAVDLWWVLADNPGTTEWRGWVDLDPVQRADLNADGCVDVLDFLSLMADWNENC